MFVLLLLITILIDLLKYKYVCTVSADKSARESRSAKEQLEQITKICNDERKAFDATIRDSFDKITEMTSKFDDESRRRQELQDINKDLRTLVDKLRNQVISCVFISN